MNAASLTSRKWRPTLGLIVAAVLATVLALPLVGLFFFRLYENQLIGRTEAELIAQSAAIGAVFAAEIERLPSDTRLGAPVPADARPQPQEPHRPVEPTLDLAGDGLLGRRPDARDPNAPADAAFAEIGARLTPVLVRTQAVTLAGFRLLDPAGVVIAGRDEVGRSLAHVEEVASALAGRFRSALRVRVSTSAAPPLYSISRGTSVRVFVAMPVVVRDRVAGVVYASRTPTNIVKHLYEERGKVALATAAVLAVTLLIGLTFARFVTGPVHELIRRTAAIGAGDRNAIRPLARHGTREFALLSDSFLRMASRLHARSDDLRVFVAHLSHELKSPLTSIRGAAELMRDAGEAGPDAMSADERTRFLGNIVADTARLALLVNRLRELAAAEGPPAPATTTLGLATGALRAAFPKLAMDLDGDAGTELPLSGEDAGIILSHLADNAARHGATKLRLRVETGSAGIDVTVSDDGCGIGANHRERVFEPFYTTRRDEGGTGMGLPIVRAFLERSGGSITLEADGGAGATFTLRFPRPA